MKPEFNRRYTDMFEFVPIGFFTFGPADRILEVNPTGANLLRADRSDLIGQSKARLSLMTCLFIRQFQIGKGWLAAKK
jgi:PAS domain-containing protein